jgi:hypothetical protein
MHILGCRAETTDFIIIIIINNNNNNNNIATLQVAAT